MLVSEILDEVKEAIGKCSDAFAIRTITRAVQLLANKGLIDPLVGYFDFSVADDYFVALPREVKTPLRVNINKQPTFSRSRIYEFHINSLGTQTGEEPGLSWSDRGYSPIQNEKALPGLLGYQVTKEADVGKTLIATGADIEGRTITEALVGSMDGAQKGTKEFHRIDHIQRQETSAEAFLLCNGTNIAGQYYGNELTPEYRVIKLSKAASNVRVMFRRHVFKLTTVDDLIPMHSELAVIQACKAVRFMGTDENDKAAAALAMAEMFLKEEQASREEHNAMADNLEIQPAIDASIFCRDGIIVADVYDAAAEIFGGIGRRAIFDKITTAIEILSNRGQWDARLGIVDVISPDNRHDVTYWTPKDELVGKGHGYFVLPRHVEIPVGISHNCGTTMPRNRWFEFHLNGDGGMMERSSCGTWDDAGETCIIRKWPLNPHDEPRYRRALPLYFVALPDNTIDINTEIRIYGFERDAEGRDIEVWRGGQRGWKCPCHTDQFDPGVEAPAFVSIERITKGESKGFIHFHATTQVSPAVPAATTHNEQTTITQWTFMGSPNDYSAGASRVVTIDPVWPLDTTFQRDITFVFTNTAPPGSVGLHISLGGDTYVHAQEMPLNIATLVQWNNYSFMIFVGDGAETVRNIKEVPTHSYIPAVWAMGDMFGMWYPDEVEPKYRAIKIPNSSAKRIRIAYRKRTPKVTSLTEPIPLRSRFAIEQQLRAIKNAGDPALASQFEAVALNYLRDERINLGPQGVTGMFQFDEATSPGFTGNIQ